MPAAFGTSGLRGLVTDLTPALVAAHVRAFAVACETGGALCLGRDLRPSSPRIAGDVSAAARAAGLAVIDCGALPTPALALAAQARGAGAVMVTGSHIPADRNGLKFYTVDGEITKEDEAAILARLDALPPPTAAPGPLETDTGATARYIARYKGAFGPRALAGRRIGVYAHSAVGRDALQAVLAALGAETVELGHSDTFIPVDTEAVDDATRAAIADWVAEYRLDALVSTDGDSDRPLLADETGRVIPGDILGQITAETLAADVVVTPISSNSGVTMKGFGRVIRTRIGSPYVIAGMTQAAGARVMGYEANGGVLLGFAAQGPAGPLPPLRTRDALLPLLAVLQAGGTSLAARVAAEPPVVTATDRLQDVPPEKSRALLARWQADRAARAAFLAELGQREEAMDLTDGLRLTLAGGGVLHIRPSGNAPELRVYVETATRAEAARLLAAARAALARLI